jgi:DNA-binding Xre family transcriptional regulator
MTTRELNASQRKALGRRIDDERTKRGMTLKQLAEKAGCGEKTVRNVIEGQHARGTTVAELCTALEIQSGEVKPISISDGMHGGYTKTSFDEYIGCYFVYRRSFSFPRNILRSVFDVQWNAQRKCLRFDEYQRYDSSEHDTIVDYSQTGEIFVSSEIGLLHFVTTTRGAVRLITTSKFRRNVPTDLTMYGIVLTQAKKPLHYQPSTAVNIFEKASSSLSADDAKKQVSVLRQGDFDYDRLDVALTDAERRIVNFALTPPPLDHSRGS